MREGWTFIIRSLKRRVKLSLSMLEAAGEALAEYAHKARQDDEVNALLLQQLCQSGLEGLLGAQLLSQQRHGGDAGEPGPLQSIGISLVGDNKADGTALYNAAFFRVNESLKIGTAAGDQNRYPGFQHMRTLSSLTATWPIT